MICHPRVRGASRSCKRDSAFRVSRPNLRSEGTASETQGRSPPLIIDLSYFHTPKALPSPRSFHSYLGLSGGISISASSTFHHVNASHDCFPRSPTDIEQVTTAIE